MTEPRTSIYPPSSIEEVAEQIVDLSADGYIALVSDVRSVRGFDGDKVRCDELAPKVGLSSEIVAVLLSALAFLYSRVSAVPQKDLIGILNNLVEGFEDDRWDETQKHKAVERLAGILSSSEKIDLSRKLRRLRSGFIKNAISFASFVDARPDYTDQNGSIRGFVPIIQFRISSDADDVRDREYLFQIDENGLQSLKDAIEAVEEKLRTLRTSGSLTAQLYDLKKN